MSNLLNKYLKYKKKYIMLKKMVGGMIDCKDIDKLGFNNVHGTCWNATILSIFLYSDKLRQITQIMLDEKFSTEYLIAISGSTLCLFLPNRFLEGGILSRKTYNLLVQIINTIKKRYFLKNKDLEESLYGVHKEEFPLPLPLRRKLSIRCEIELPELFYTLFDMPVEYGGNYKDVFFLLNILSITLLGIFITTNNNFFYYLDINDSDRIFMQDPHQWIQKGEKKIFDESMIASCLGVIMNTLTHTVGFFKCGTGKFITNSTIIDFNWDEFFKTINELTCYVIIYYKEKLFIIGYDDVSGYKKYIFNPDKKEVIPNPHAVYKKKDIVTQIIFLNTEHDISRVVNTSLQCFYTYYKYNDMIKLLTDTDNINCVDHNGNTFLILLIKDHKEDEVKDLLNRFLSKIDIELKNYIGMNALMIAIIEENIPIIKLLREKKAVVDSEVMSHVRISTNKEIVALFEKLDPLQDLNPMQKLNPIQKIKLGIK